MRTAVKLFLAASLVSFMVLFLITPAHATYVPGTYGEQCTGSNGCGIGAHIVTSTLSCVVYDSNPSDPPVACQRNLANYPTLPLTADNTHLVMSFDTDIPMVGYVYGGVGLNTTNRNYVDSNHTPTTHHVVDMVGLVAATTVGNNNGPPTWYVAACNSFPCVNSDPSFNSWPGPTCTADGVNCFLQIATPLPVQVLPFVPQFIVMGHEEAWQGHFAEIPLLIIWKNGSFPTVASLTSAYPNYAATAVAHVSSNSPNGGNWLTSSGTAWAQQASPPALYYNVQLVIGGTTYQCHGDVNGGHNPVTFQPSSTCTAVGGANSQIAVTIFYAGSVGGSGEDFRTINYDSTLGEYWTNLPDSIAPTGNGDPQINIEIYGCNSSCTGGAAPTGNITVNIQPTLMNDATHHIPAAGSTIPPISFTVNMRSVPSIPVAQPSSFSADSNELSYLRQASQAVQNQCNTPNFTYAMPWWIQTQHTWLWFIPSATNFGEFLWWNYDNSRVYLGAKDQFSHKMDGTAWGDWAGNTAFGGSYNTLIIKPTVNNPNGYYFIATNSGTSTTGAEPNWNSVGIGNTISDGSGSPVIWRNLGNVGFMEGCVNQAQQPYLNAVVLSGDHSMTQFSQFMGGFRRSEYQTGDAIAKDGGTTTGLFQRALYDGYCYNPNATECVADHGSYGGGIWGGMFSLYSENAGRGVAYVLDSAATFWSEAAEKGQGSLFTSDLQRERNVVWAQNACINLFNYTGHQTPGAAPDGLFSSNDYPAHAELPYMYGLCGEALIEFENVDKELDPTNSLGLLDDRVDIALKEVTGYIWMNWFDQPFATQGIHTYSNTYTPKDLDVISGSGGVGGTTNVFFNELNNMVTDMYTYLYNKFGGTAGGFNLPDGTSYDTASDLMRMGGLAGYHCTTHWFCTQFSDSLWLHPFTAGTGTPKEFGQSYKWGGLGNTYQWRLGFRPWSQSDLSSASNPCRDGSNGANPCASGHHSAFPDNVAAYPYQPYPVGNFTQQNDPSDCTNGTGHCHFVGDPWSPIQNVTNSSVQVQFHTYEQVSSAKVNWGTSANNCTSGTVSVEHTGYPICSQPGFTTLEDCVHLFDVTSLQPATTYNFQLSTTDMSGNVATNNCNTTQGNWVGGGIQATTLSGPLQLSILTTSLPGGTLTISYSQQLRAQGGSLPYSWSIVAGHGSLPNGLSITTDGVISGIPTVAGSFSFQVQVQDGSSPQQTATQDLTIVIQSLVITTPSLPGGSVGIAYSASVSASGGITPYTWSAPAVGTSALPPGLTINSSSGVISGTPTQAGTFNSQVTVKDNSSPTQEVFSKTFPIVISGTCSLSVTTTTLPGGTVGVLYSANLSAACGTPPYTFTLNTGSLPPGLNLSPSGAITGTPTTAGTSTFTVQVQDTATPPNTAVSGSLSITIAGNTLIITTTTLPNAIINSSYSTMLGAAGGTRPYTWAITVGSLPPGTSLNSSTGVISGTPTQFGQFNFTAQVTDSTVPTPQTATANLSITVQAQTLVITTTLLPGGGVGVSYTTPLGAIGGEQPYVNWTVSSGALPPGLSLDPTTGIISGTPSATGTYSFQVQVQDSGTPQQTATSQQLSITIISVRIVNTMLAIGTQGSGYSQTLTATGGQSPYTFSIDSGFMPSGLSLVGSTGVISGTPTICGFFNIVWRATDQNQLFATKSLPIDITGCSVSILTQNLPGAFQNVPYSTTLQATGGTGQGYTWSITVGTLPAGLTLSSSGVITGTPTGTGTSSFTVQVLDSGSNSATANLSIAVSGNVVIITTSLPNAIINTLYSAVVQAAGGQSPYSFCIFESDNVTCDDGSGGALPAGLSLGFTSGFITGTATTLGVSSFIVQVTDFNGVTAVQNLSIAVVPPSSNVLVESGGITFRGYVVLR